ncbi:rRNA maturation RNase YbeY [uncultured Sphaerochaeta sp.]|uniref:rRNA maturation RNase YbeY n=1 Tax=uncultured Sphaerochaeta sp. TaxID=886478 RepID=UPI002A0A3520|nr:rRNA maturation RNase YbeY [uncultured Sphaerochaeta sp.]
MNEPILDISYEEEQYKKLAPEDLVVSRLKAILAELKKENSEISVTFASDATIQELNKTYRAKDEPTDILSFVQTDEINDFDWPDFSYEQGDEPEEGNIVLGDIVISLDTLQRNAQSFTVSIDEELFRLLIHGVLHLLGGDHKTNEESEPMLRQQEELLSRLGGKQL